MQPHLLHGIVPAMATPFRPGGTDVDRPAIARLVDFLIGANVHGIFALGSTGEAVLLDTRQRRLVAECVLERTAGRLPVFIHVGALRPAEVLELAKHAVEIGAAGVVVLPPYYYSLDDTALEAFFSRIAEAVPLPFFLYNIPMNAKNTIRPQLFARLSARYPHLLGLKDSSMDFGAYLEFVQARRPDQSLMMGNDSQILPALLMGGTGAVSAGATAIPEPYVLLWQALQAGDLVLAKHWQSVCTRVRLMFAKPYPIAPIKRVLELRGIMSSDIAPPLRGLSEMENSQLEQEYTAVQAQLTGPN